MHSFECVDSHLVISDYIHYKLWDEITYPFPNFNGCTVDDMYMYIYGIYHPNVRWTVTLPIVFT